MNAPLPTMPAVATIHVVDDDTLFRNSVARLLRASGYQTAIYESGDDFLTKLPVSESGCILLDLQMPGMDGFDVMEGLKADDVDSYLPVIVLTAQPAHKLRALQAGAKDFISKPFDLLEVKTRIHNMLEVRLLYKTLESHNEVLEQTVRERTAELRDSEHRFRRLTELASDWYWEQNETGDFTQLSGPVTEMIGVRMTGFLGERTGEQSTDWNEEEREALQAKIAARQPFIDFGFSRTNADGSRQQFRVSGEPMFNESCRFTGYRGIGVEVTSRSPRRDPGA